MGKAPEWLKRYCLKRVGGEEGLRKLREMYESKASVRDIMKEFGLKSPQCIYALIESSRRKYRKHKKRIGEDVKSRVIELRGKGASIPQISREVGISVGSVYNILKEAGIAGPKKRQER